MGRQHRVLLLGLVALAGCGGDSGGSSSSPGPGFTGTVYKVWTAWITDAAAGDAARAALVASNGNPAAPTWTEVDGGSATKVFDPAAPPASINAILVQASAGTNYRLDSVEILDAQDRVVEHASGTVWSNLVDLSGKILGAPDGDDASTEAAGAANAFVFTRYAGPIDRFRLNARCETQPPIPGDVEVLGRYVSPEIERPGGLAIDKSGTVYLTLAVDKAVRLARYGLDGALVDEIELAAGVTAAAGSHSVALDKNGAIFTAATAGNGQVVVRKHQPTLAEVWKVTFASGLGGDLVESNGIAADEDGNVLLAGGMNSATGGVNHWLARLTGEGAVLFDKRPELDLSATTHWRGVAPGGGSNHIYATGDQGSETLNLIQAQTARFSSSGAPQWDDQFGGEDGLADASNAVALDPEGDLIVAGHTGTAAEGRNGVLIRYGTSGVPLLITLHNGVANGDDEILDLALDEDGSIYAVGYETAAGQGENMWVRKYDANLNPVWTRTHHGGFGNDRAISVAIYEDQLVVAGFETASGGKTKLALRVYAK